MLAPTPDVPTGTSLETSPDDSAAARAGDPLPLAADKMWLAGSSPAMTAAEAGATPQGTHRYDICFFLNRRRALHFLDRGVMLDAEGLSCTADGSPGTELFANITAVHLQTSGGKTNTGSCAIGFADGNVLTVLSCDRGGYSDAACAASYRAFVHALHARLAAAPGTIRFTEGWPLWRCQAVLLVAAGTAVLFAGLGLWELFCLRNLQGPVLLAVGGYASWRFYRVSINNLPRDYTPDRLPEFLLS
jgi:hypothetical protein